MIDTVKLYTENFSIKKNNRFEVMTRVDYSTGEIKSEKLFCNLPNSNIDIKELKGDRKLFLQTSIPKLLYGTSFYETSENDIERAIQSIEQELELSGVYFDKNNLDNFKLSRVDFCKNIKVDHSIMDYLVLLSGFRKSRTDKFEIKKETISFRNKSQELIIYNKIKEILDTVKEKNILKLVENKEQNILRVESKLKKKSVIDRELKNNKLKFVDIFDKNKSRAKLLKDINCLYADKSNQLDLNFNENLELLRDIKSKRNRGVFKEFLAIKGVDRLFNEFQYDWEKIKELLLSVYKKSQVYGIMSELKQYHLSIIDYKERDLLKEIKYKLAA